MVGLKAKCKKNFKTYTKWRFMTCSTNKSWTLIFFAKNCILNRDAYLNGCIHKREVTIIVQTSVGGLCMLFPVISHIVGMVYLKNQGHFTHETESPWPLHFKHSDWWKRRSRFKFASHYAWGTNWVCESKMDVKSTWHPTYHVSWSLGLFSKTTSWR